MRRLIKWFTYYKRFNRIKNKIFERFIKKYPFYPLYDSKTGRKRIKKIKLWLHSNGQFNVINGKFISFKLQVRIMIFLPHFGGYVYICRNGSYTVNKDNLFDSIERKYYDLDQIILRLRILFKDKYKFINAMKEPNNLHLDNNLYSIIVNVPKEETIEFLRIVKNEILSDLAKDNKELPLIIPVHDYEN